MGAKRGRLEGKFTFAANLTQNFTSTAGTDAVTITAGTYTWTELYNSLDTQVGTNSQIVLALSRSETGTGRFTLTCAAGNMTVTWTSTTLRDVLGFTINVSGTQSATGANQVKGMWLPNVPKLSKHGDDDSGRLVTDLHTTTGPQGHMSSFVANSYRVHEGLAWNGVAAAKAKTHHETLTGESLETFWTDVILGGKSYFKPNAECLFFWDAGDTATADAVVGRFINWQTFDPSTSVLGWVGRYNVALPPLVVES